MDSHPLMHAVMYRSNHSLNLIGAPSGQCNNPSLRCQPWAQPSDSYTAASAIINYGMHYFSSCRVLTVDGIIDDAKRRRYYEKPCIKRRRENYENCRRIYNMEMARKVAFLMQKNRPDPWLGY
ncbi:hypothetical protein NDU88_001098 [Pleurodeles waltl]|uniref:28S ribosomal protein S21, mitochondrial n=1 Tax=Pleurodeles waltl TaxID=8319 RepID=A0AAV7KRQ7_PLEWA|nr:hypothetical protein NDU88_001098 [Pleurodeles waltl]